MCRPTRRGRRDNDGLWTAMYVAAECFRFKVTGDADARENARRGMQAIMRLEQITGRPGFPRALVHQGRRRRAAEGRRVARHAGQGVAMEGGHQLRRDRRPLLRLSDLLRPGRRREREAGAAGGDRPHHQSHPRQRLSADRRRTASATRWGWWAPDVIWEDADETGLRALHMLSHLRVADVT